MNAYVEALRLERWPRSSAILLGSVVYIFLQDNSLRPTDFLGLAWRVGLAFLLTWGVSTVNYVINEIADAPFDRHHPTKKMRPLVSGRIQKGPFIFIGIFIGLFCFTLAWLGFNPGFFFSLLALLAAGFLYNVRPLRTKDIPFIDAVSESVNNPIRFLAGWFALCPDLSLFPPVSLLIAWWAFGHFLMVAKRLSELRWLKNRATDYRQSLGKYSHPSLLLGMTIASLVFFASYIYFCLEYNLNRYLFYIPLLAVYFLLFFWKTLKEKAVMEEPEGLFRRPIFALYTIGLVILFLLSFRR